MIRIGKVVDVNKANRTVRVSFEEADGLVSDHLKVISTPPEIRSEEEISVSVWMPSYGDTVLCLYYDEPNADGYVIGGLS